MTVLSTEILFFLETILFATVVFMHMSRKNYEVIILYGVQSAIITLLLLISSLKAGSILLVGITILTFIIKVIVAPYFFSRLINNNKLQHSASAYLSLPSTLIVLAGISSLSYSHFFKSLTFLAPNDGNTLSLSLAMIFISMFLMINRKGVLSQMIGVLSLENAIVSFAFISGLEASAGPQIGILFDILVWVIIATVFASMVYRHFGSLDSNTMAQLKED